MKARKWAVITVIGKCKSSVDFRFFYQPHSAPPNFAIQQHSFQCFGKWSMRTGSARAWVVRNEEGVGGKLFGLLLPRNPCDSVALCDSVRTDFLTRVVGRPCSSFSGAEKDTLALSWQINSFQVFMDMSVESVEACDWQCRVSDFTTRDANRSHVEACNQVVIYASMERVIQCWCLDQCACK
uniref:Uncharacterized protein n=1 Tax=Physcomitrium patens TaxID=3218 RepID=A0A7I4BZX1_PHYPA